MNATVTELSTTHDITSLRDAVEATLGCEKSRVVRIDLSSTAAWVKRAVPHKRKLLHPVQRAVSRLVPLRLLRFTGEVGGAASLDLEVRILERLRARGVRVPRVLARGADWIMLEDLGVALDRLLRKAPDSRSARELVAIGAWALLRLHRLGAWHGNAQARNLVLQGDAVGFIDFEEDVGAQLGAEASRSRDWILFLCSLHQAERRFPGLMASLVREIARDLPEPTRRTLLHIRVLGTPLALVLRPFDRWLGRDVRQALALWEATGEIDPQLRRRLRLLVRIGVALGALFYLYGANLD